MWYILFLIGVVISAAGIFLNREQIFRVGSGIAVGSLILLVSLVLTLDSPKMSGEIRLKEARGELTLEELYKEYNIAKEQARVIKFWFFENSKDDLLEYRVMEIRLKRKLDIE